VRNLILKNSGFKYCYKIADSLYQSDTQIKELEYLLQAPFQFNSKKVNFSNQSPKTNTIFHHLTPIGEDNYPLHVLFDKDKNYHVKINDDLYSIGNNSIHANIQNIDVTVLMGPVFILHLAKNWIFCLHASAFIVNDTSFILMAESGTGKSTIARYIQQQKLGTRIADDIVPLKIIKEKLTILPSFPQLKLNQEQQHTGENVSFKTVAIFASKSSEETSLSKINQFQAMINLIQHSVATKLFAESELKNHLSFCHQMSSRIDAYELNYQHNKNSLNQFWKLINDII